MAPYINILMTSQEPLKPLHTKILEVFRSKAAKKNLKDPRQQLFFKIRPEKSVSQLIIPYKDLKDNFPYALIEYYENNIKIKNDSSTNFEQLVVESENKSRNFKSIRREDKKQSTSKVQAKKEDLIPLQEKNDLPEGENVGLMLDFDKYSQETDRPIMKSYHVLFSESETNYQNRYLKDLNNDENNMYARRSDSNTSNYESKRKKMRIDYAE